MANPTVVIMMGSSSDLEAMQPAADVLAELGVPVEVRVMSAHRTPARAAEFASTAHERGVKVLICGAGGAAHLAGVVAAHTVLPVIGVPLARTPLAGMDALYATVQMPAGVPVATVAVDGATNAGLLAASIIAVGDNALADKLRKRRETTATKVAAQDEDVRKKASRL
jgi:phosphoribosylaminoimidazole carboxylase PurE protein